MKTEYPMINITHMFTSMTAHSFFTYLQLKKAFQIIILPVISTMSNRVGVL